MIQETHTREWARFVPLGGDPRPVTPHDPC